MNDLIMVDCKKLHATVSEQNCYLRFGQVKYHAKKTRHQFDCCKDCETGKEIYERLLQNNGKDVLQRKVKEKICVSCKKSIGLSMFQDNGNGDICLDCIKAEKTANIEPDKKDVLKESLNNFIQTEKVKVKTCSKCKTEKSVTEFYKKSTGTKDGLNGWCKVCCNISVANYQKSKSKKKVEKTPDKSDDFKMVIDFSDNKELFTRLAERSKAEFRTIEAHILWCCNALTK